MEAKRTALMVAMAVLLLSGLSCVGRAEKPASEIAPAKPDDVPDKWSRVNVAGEFYLRLPPGMVEKKVQGIDSLVHKYQSDKITLNSDYGWYSDRLKSYNDNPNYKKTKLSVGDRSAYIVTYGKPDGNLPLVAAIHFPDPTGDKMISLTVVAECKDAKSQEVAVQILKSITFP